MPITWHDNNASRYIEITDYHRRRRSLMSTAASTTPIHPGEILAEEYLAPLGITQHGLAVALHVPPRRINEIVHGKRRISADTALMRRTLLRNLRALLDEPPRPLRPRGRTRPSRIHP
jgi:addiction module HigA family antidote